MKLAIDFDGTYTADPCFFRELMALAARHGHACVIVTGRSDEPPWGDQVRESAGAVPIVFAAGGWKRSAALRAGHAIDVWIDDVPEYVAPQLDPEATAMRAAREP